MDTFMERFAIGGGQQQMGQYPLAQSKWSSYEGGDNLWEHLSSKMDDAMSLNALGQFTLQRGDQRESVPEEAIIGLQGTDTTLQSVLVMAIGELQTKIPKMYNYVFLTKLSWLLLYKIVIDRCLFDCHELHSKAEAGQLGYQPYLIPPLVSDHRIHILYKAINRLSL